MSRAAILRAFWRARRSRRWSPERLRRHQLAGLRRLPGLSGATDLDAALASLPLVSPRDFAAQFSARNALGLSLDEARRAAREEIETGVSPDRDYSFGLSSGSTGEPGVFLTSAAERARWIGTILGRFLPLRRLLRPRGVDIALLLKHNSRLYTDVAATGRLRLHYFDLAQPLARWATRLLDLRPQILVGPPSVLCELAAAQPAAVRRLAPEMVLAGAEPLFPRDRAALTAAFGVAPRGIYQAKEGFLGWGCEYGRLHLNEDLMVFEAQRFVSHPQRMVPVITDFTRRSQSYWRCRVDDVLLRDESRCPCGDPRASIAAVEGRLEDVLLRRDRSPIFPLELDAVLARHLAPGSAGTLLQHDIDRFTLGLDGSLSEALRADLLALLHGLHGGSGPAPRLDVVPSAPAVAGEKRRRFQRRFDPHSELLTGALLPPRRLSS